MITLDRIKYTWVLKDCLRFNDLYKTMLDGQDLDDYNPDMNQCIWFQAELNNEPAGIVMIRQFSTNALAIHGGLYKKFRDNSHKLLQECMDILRKDNKWIYVTTIHERNIPAQKVAEKAGFIYKTTIPDGYMTGDLLLYSEK